MKSHLEKIAHAADPVVEAAQMADQVVEVALEVKILLFSCLLFYDNILGSKIDRNCKYECQGNGGCEVTYIGPSRPGQLSGSCFPASFGGSCSGTPRECQDCNRAVSCSSGGSSSNSRTSGGSSSNGRPSGGGGSGGENMDIFTCLLFNEIILGSKSDRNCKYECQSNRGCMVTYIGQSRPGQLSGSCFPASFGGSCSGTPPECQDCNRAVNC